MPPNPAPRIPAARRRVPATAVAVAAALTLAACSSEQAPAPDGAAPAASTPTTSAASPAPSSPPAEPSADPTPTPSVTAMPTEPDRPTFDARTERALQTIAAMETSFGAGAFTIEVNDDGTEWKMELAQGDDRLKVKAEADTTGVAPTDTKRDDLDGDDRAALSSARVSLSQAIVRVVETSGGVLDEAELEEDDGTALWKVSVRLGDDDVDYRVDVSTGAVWRDD
ncbi:PepSY domain-containing protein [Isoptericola sediminis]|uniref:PepSY domain-containing protein n=1 Tax=Isoptericola sediminis TaxID=2733572 RepID=A0A849K2R4_9MICO|nr:PepSY domain-containing protein [Isoptericola sediminis]NNU26590.1 hypothetical protein [Isoptericola sediminis]